MKTVIATSDGYYLLNNRHHTAKSSVYASGNFDTATAKLVYRNTDGTYSDLQDGAIATGEQIQVFHGASIDIYVSVIGSSGNTKIEFKCAGVD